MKAVYDVTDASTRDEGIEAAVTALGEGKLAVVPTDTVYGVAADAFDPAAVEALLTARSGGSMG